MRLKVIKIVTKDKTIISEFEVEFDLPNKDFNEKIKQNLKVTLIRNKFSSYGYAQDESFFEVKIPKHLKEILIDTYPEYQEFKENQTFNTQERNFKNIVRDTDLNRIIKKFQEMTNKALFLKEVERADIKNKVIFITSSSSCKSDRDDWNFADMNLKLNLSFQFFIAYEMEEKNNFLSKSHWNYFGLKRNGNSSINNKYKETHLPIISTSTTKRFKKIKWTQEREDYLTQMQNAIIEIQDKIHNFVENIDEDNIEKLMSQSNIPRLLEKK